MFKTLTREITLAIQAKNGASVGVVFWLVVTTAALLTAFVFLCVAGYDWLSPRYGRVHAGLIMAGGFVVIAIVAAISGALVRRRVRERAILARAAKAQTPAWLLDPRVLGVAAEAGRSLGWERIIPVALLGFLAASWARQRRDKGGQNL
jgi:MFS family permease